MNDTVSGYLMFAALLVFYFFGVVTGLIARFSSESIGDEPAFRVISSKQERDRARQLNATNNPAPQLADEPFDYERHPW